MKVCAHVRHKELAYGVKYLFLNKDLNEIKLKQLMKQNARKETAKPTAGSGA